jgi:farnesyl diphosphate synthase
MKGSNNGAPRLSARIQSISLPTALRDASRTVDEMLESILPAPHGLQAQVHEAMRYATFAGGKRLRPFLVLNAAKLFGVPIARAARVAAAIEVLHTYSLVHDDLPCMDDDDLRRGRPTTHIAFDEMTAVLAGDALLTIAFEILAEPNTHPSAEVRSALGLRLAQAAGSNGMIGGQMIDMQGAQNAFGSEEIIHLQRLKTGQLFDFSCEAGAILAEAKQEDRDRLRSFARDMGLVFQITDDLLDVTSTAEKTGKAVGKDKEQGKATLVAVMGVEGARAEAARLARRASATLAPYGNAAPELCELPLYLLDRES